MTEGTLGIDTLEFLRGHGFEPDPFQLEAIGAIERGETVVVTAPTGAGKTLVAAAAVHLALASGARAFYTAPIKALSNQKFDEFRQSYGIDQVGLLTGDNVVNPDAPIVVMTTEVLRNMIYAEARSLEDLAVVVLDEVHYLQDRYRGSVWEEVIIHLPRHVQLVNLSATIANPDEFAEWIAARRGPTALVVETHRPVPLESCYLLEDRFREGALLLLPVFAKDGRRPNPEVVRLLRKGRGRTRRFRTPRRLEVVEELARRDLLPAIYFIFSRAGCEQAASFVAAADPGFTTPDQRLEIDRIVEARTRHLPAEDLTALGFEGFVERLRRGVAAHHAGMVPAFKETVEELFAEGLLAVVFATETLALGINMPARTVVLESLSRFTGEGHELLRPGDYTQLTGRAGRRGIDEAGTAVVLHTPYVPFEKVAEIAAAGAHPLVSSFQPNYNMAVNLVAKYSRERAEELLRASFGQFHVDRRRRRLTERMAAVEAEIAELEEAARCEVVDVAAHLAAVPSSTELAARAREFVVTTRPGDVFQLDDGLRWVLVARGYGRHPRLAMVSEQGELRRFRPTDLGRGGLHLGRMSLPEPIRPRDPAWREEVGGLVARWRSSAPPRPVLGDLAEGPEATCPDLDRHLEALRRIARLQRELRRLRRRRDRTTADLVGRFHATLDVLEGWGYVSGWRLTERGRRLRFVYTEMDLLLTESVVRGHLLGLDPAELAAVVSCFTYERRSTSPAGETTFPARVVEARYEAIRGLWERLVADEEAAGLPTTREPDPGFAFLVHRWARGEDLEALFAGSDVQAGDFVRGCRQLLDLLRQLRDHFPGVAETAAAAVRAVDRGVVAVGGAA
ncbi:MAG TPA: DEAD/DEAH box helicase [Actinobacteria bacterium]|nr:DEAD/DEAH box helicase [Actinomycetota bacterium]